MKLLVFVYFFLAYNALEELFHAMRRETSHATNYLANLACTFLDETGVLVFAAEAPYIGIFWPRFSYSVAKRGVIQLNNIMKKQKHGFGAGESIRIYPSGSLVKDCGWISKGGFMRWFADNDFIMFVSFPIHIIYNHLLFLFFYFYS